MKKHKVLIWSVVALLVIVLGLITWQYAKQIPLQNAHNDDINRFYSLELYAPIEGEDRSVIYGGGIDVIKPYLQVERKITISGKGKEVLSTVKKNLDKQSAIITSEKYTKRCDDVSAGLTVKDSKGQEFTVNVRSTKSTNLASDCSYIDIDQQTFEVESVGYLFARTYYY